MILNEVEQERQILFYKDMLETFYTTNYPDIEINDFWKWFNQMLIGEAKILEELDAEEKEVLLVRLKQSGDLILKHANLFS